MGEWSAGKITALWENHHVTWTGFVGAEGEEKGGEEPQFLMQLAFNSQKPQINSSKFRPAESEYVICTRRNAFQKHVRQSLWELGNKGRG